MSNHWFYGACGFVSWLTEFYHSHWSPAKEKAFLILVIQQQFSTPPSLSKMVVWQVTHMPLGKERNKNV